MYTSSIIFFTQVYMDQHFDQQYTNGGGAKSHTALIVVISVIVTALITSFVVFFVMNSKLVRLKAEKMHAQSTALAHERNVEKKTEEVAQLTNKVTELENELTVANNPFSDWSTHTDEANGYSIMFPKNFSFNNGTIANYDASEQRFDMSGINRLNIQVQKHSLPAEFTSFEAYAAKVKATSEEFTEPAVSYTLGDYVVLSQYTTGGPGGAFMTYIAHKENTNTMYHVLVFETGFTNNKELAEKIISTFQVL